MINFDNINSSPLDPEVVIKMTEVLINHYASPLADYSSGRQSAVIFEDSRELVARKLGADPEQIDFANDFLREIAEFCFKLKKDENLERVVFTNNGRQVLFKAFLYAAEQHNIEFIDLKEKAFDNSLKETLQAGKKTLIAASHVDLVNGKLLPVKNFCSLAAKYNALTLVDFSLTFPFYKLDFRNHPVDFGIISSGIFHSPKNLTLWYSRRRFHEKNEKFCLKQENEPDLPVIAGFAEYCENLKHEENLKHVLELGKEVIECLYNINILRISYNFPLFLNLFFVDKPDISGLLFLLDERGIACEPIFCNSDNEETGIRLSFGKYNTSDDVQAFCQIFLSMLKTVPQ